MIITPGSEEEEVLRKDLQELLDILIVLKEEDRVVYHTRRRHIL
jgi:DNA mismatch repair protein MutH